MQQLQLSNSDPLAVDPLQLPPGAPGGNIADLVSYGIDHGRLLLAAWGRAKHRSATLKADLLQFVYAVAIAVGQDLQQLRQIVEAKGIKVDRRCDRFALLLKLIVRPSGEQRRLIAEWAAALRYLCESKVDPNSIAAKLIELGGTRACADAYAARHAWDKYPLDPSPADRRRMRLRRLWRALPTAEPLCRFSDRAQALRPGRFVMIGERFDNGDVAIYRAFRARSDRGLKSLAALLAKRRTS